MRKDFIVKSIGGFFYVDIGEKIIECKARGVFRNKKIKPVAGDTVQWHEENGMYVIDAVCDRKNSFIRPPIANLDVLFIVASSVEPSPNYLLLDRMTVIACEKEVKPVVVVTKTDLSSHLPLIEHFQNSGIECVAVNYDEGTGFDEIKAHIEGNMCAFCGNSGVGKTTLLNALMPGMNRATNEISNKLGRGKHTTREVEIFPCFGGWVADTPGFSSVELLKYYRVPKENLQFDFPEIAKLYGNCRFRGCSHCGEVGCAVAAAVEDNQINQSRWNSYKAMFEESSQIQDWEVHDG